MKNELEKKLGFFEAAALVVFLSVSGASAWYLWDKLPHSEAIFFAVCSGWMVGDLVSKWVRFRFGPEIASAEREAAGKPATQATE